MQPNDWIRVEELDKEVEKAGLTRTLSSKDSYKVTANTPGGPRVLLFVNLTRINGCLIVDQEDVADARKFYEGLKKLNRRPDLNFDKEVAV